MGRDVYLQAHSAEQAEGRNRCSDLAKLLLINFFAPGELIYEELQWALDLVAKTPLGPKQCPARNHLNAVVGDTGMCRDCASKELAAAVANIEHDGAIV